MRWYFKSGFPVRRYARSYGTQAFGHTIRRLCFTDKRIDAGGEYNLLTGVQMADNNNDQRCRASLSEFLKS